MSVWIELEDGQRSTASAVAIHERLIWLDVARTIALLGMVGFHFVRDLEFFGIVPAGSTMTGGWAILAHIVAGSFIFIAGISFVIAHGSGFRARAWMKRFLLISGAAALVTAATYFALPERFIYFGILHAIAAASIVGVVLLGASAPTLIALAALIAVADMLVNAPVFSSPWLAWTGVGATVRPSLDFVPLVPWLAPFLAGMAIARFAPLRKLDLQMRSSAVTRMITWPGQNSLFIYLVHQPLLLAAMWMFVRLM